MTVQEAIVRSGSTWSAYRYDENGDLVWAELIFSNNRIKYGDARGYINGVPVYPSLWQYENKLDWKPWPKLMPLPAKNPGNVT